MDMAPLWTGRCGRLLREAMLHLCRLYSPIFKAVQPFFRPKLGTGESFRFWADEWSGNGRLSQSFLRLFALASDPEGSVRQAWQNAWAPALPAALSDQRVLDFMQLQELLANQRPAAGPDAWIWSGQNFTVRAVYLRLRERADSEDPLFLRLWRRVWKSRIPLKIRIFVWLLLRQRLMTRSFQQRMAPDSSGDCALCGATMEDCEHLFVLCPISQAVWWSVSVARLELTSLEDFWRSIGDSPYRRVAEWQLIFATLWSIWINRNDVIFRGRTPSVDAILHDARGLAISWNQGRSGPLTFVLL